MNQLDTEIKLLNASGLADAMGVNAHYISRMKRAGFPMPDGRATVKEALAWRRENPTYHIPKEHHQDASDQQDVASCK